MRILLELFRSPVVVILVVVLALFLTKAGAEEFGGAQKRGCAEIARAFLAQHRMVLKESPKVFVTVPIKLAGWFDSGIVFVRGVCPRIYPCLAVSRARPR
jgi:hypothetical protein